MVAMAALERLGIAQLAQTALHHDSFRRRAATGAAGARAGAGAAVHRAGRADRQSSTFGNQGKVMREIRALAASGLGVLFTTHDPNHALRAANRAYLLRDGKRPRRGAGETDSDTGATGSALRGAGAHDYR